MNQPSPRPFRVDEDQAIYDANHNLLMVVNGIHSSGEQDRIDADLIVCAVNSHEKLLKWAKEYLEDKILENHIFDGRYDVLIQEIETDIKEAEGE